ncbi:SH3 and PX domain-containing protein 2B-like isoform X2 [Clavelina lepadiformis]|uniref:SH3 and PX domain-containing protein 2B-like isoform X2 n=1 Tax=Clavelina lepadiformis TaxID=159417 RepID=UPI0040422DC2
MSSKSKRKLELIRVVDVEKRRSPTKHYAYVIEVQWSDGSLCRIGRRFSSFFDMHMSLLEKFPVEGGQKDPSTRIIPYLPGKTLFQRAASRDATMKRLGSITEYCDALTKLPSHISQCNILQNFFEMNSSDMANNTKDNKSEEGPKPISSISGPVEFESYVAVADYKSDAKTQLRLRAGESLEVVEKNENGWWLVCNMYGSNGWVPGTYLEKADGEREDLTTEKAEPGKGMWYYATNAFEATSEEEISFPFGAAVEVLQKNLEGWWLAKYNGNEGWVPGSYLKRSDYLCNQDQDLGDQQTNATDLDETKLTPVRKPPPKRETICRQLGPPAIDPENVYYITQFPFQNTIQDGISFEAGEKAKVIEEADNGWWYVSIDGREGWAPTDFLSVEASQKNEDISPLKNASNGNGLTKFKSQTSGNQSGNRPCRPPLPVRPNLSPVKSPSFPRKPFPLPTQVERRKLQNFNGPFTSKTETAFVQKSPAKRTPSPSKVSIENEIWFKDVSRQVAEQALKNEDKEGYFIVRRSKTGGPQIPYSLTLYHRKLIFNFHIRLREIDKRFATGVFSEGEKTFASVRDMVEFYKDNTLVVGDHSNLVKLVNSPRLINYCRTHVLKLDEAATPMT